MDYTRTTIRSCCKILEPRKFLSFENISCSPHSQCCRQFCPDSRLKTIMTMANQDKLVDYYKVLECDKTATDEELKKSYQRLVLASHPDKKQMDCATFHLIHKAYTILRDPERRKHYDAEMSCQDHNQLLVYETVKLSDMTFHSEHGVYMYYCRCGGVYMLDECDSHEPVLVGCDECSFSIKVN